MHKDEIEAQLAAKRSTQHESYDQVEQRVKELQDRMASLASPSSSLVGEVESRQERYERHQRLESRRRQFQQTAQIPLSKRVRSQTTTVIALIGIMILLFITSFFGGSIAGKFLNQRPNVSTVETAFWQNMLTKNYYAAHDVIDPRLDTSQQFNTQATVMEKAVGPITSYTKVSSVAEGTFAYTITYRVNRSGGTIVTNSSQSTIIMRYFFNTTFNNWYIVNLGTLITPPQ